MSKIATAVATSPCALPTTASANAIESSSIEIPSCSIGISPIGGAPAAAISPIPGAPIGGPGGGPPIGGPGGGPPIGAPAPCGGGIGTSGLPPAIIIFVKSAIPAIFISLV